MRFNSTRIPESANLGTLMRRTLWPALPAEDTDAQPPSHIVGELKATDAVHVQSSQTVPTLKGLGTELGLVANKEYMRCLHSTWQAALNEFAP